MLGRQLAIGTLFATLWFAPPAAAQHATGDFGGGAVASAPAPVAGSMAIGLRAPNEGTSVRIAATVVGRCASGTFYETVPVAADGAFTAIGAVRQARTTMRYELRGVLSEQPSGTLTARFERTTSTRTRRCRAADVVWEARRPGAGPGDPATTTLGGLVLGTSAQREPGGAPLGIALRRSADGRSVSRAIYGVRMDCLGIGRSPTFDLPRDDLAIGLDGSVADVQAGLVKTDASILKYLERFNATLGSTGARGTFSVELSVRRRATGKRVTLCRSGDVDWSASS